MLLIKVTGVYWLINNGLERHDRHDQHRIKKVKNGCYFLAHAASQFTPAVKTEQPEVVLLFISYLTTVGLFVVHTDKKWIMLGYSILYHLR